MFCNFDMKKNPIFNKKQNRFELENYITEKNKENSHRKDPKEMAKP